VRWSRFALASVIVISSIGAAGCGGGGGSEGSSTTTGSETTPVVEWAGNFCTAVKSWKDQLGTIGSDLASSPSKDGLQQAADGVKAADQTLSDDLHSLGTPDTESGQKVKQSVDDLSTTVNTELTTIEDAAKNASGITGVVSAGATISASLAAMSTALSNTFQTIDAADVKGDMKTAFDQASSCSGVVGSSS
jgi:hypothetical protein